MGGTRTPTSAWIAVLGTALAVASVREALSATPRTPEQEAILIAKRLKPIPDEEWQTIAGERASERYEIVKGDTLYDISKRLFGDARYWPKIWALNNQSITNPHLIRPGNAIAFLPGTGSSLPAVAINGMSSGGGSSMTASSDGRRDTVTTSASGRSQEWRGLPRQRWENVPVAMPAEVDAQGFDSRNIVRFNTPTGMELAALSATERLTTLGQITGSRSEGAYLTSGDTVYIRADEEIQVGETYALTQEPETLKSRKSDRTGYSYLILGKVKIIGVKDGMFIGTIVAGRDLIYRGAQLIPVPGRVKNLSPIAGPSPLEGVLMIDKNLATYTVAQHKTVFIDRGSDDGVQPGMVFRAYQHYDPSNERRITDSDFIIDADILVVQVSEEFSTGLIISSLSPVTQNSSVVLLTDISDLLKNKGFRERSTDEKQRDDELDELDKLDRGGGLGKDEERELRQLEKWEGNPPTDPASSDNPLDAPVDGPTPEMGAEDVPPPPPIEGETPPTAPDAEAAPELEPLPDAPLPDAPADASPPSDDEPSELPPLPPPDSAPPAGDDALPPLPDGEMPTPSASE